jgi:peptidoglycan/xylan/chitin deacetylase (PgdA/CDA1 family)
MWDEGARHINAAAAKDYQPNGGTSGESAPAPMRGIGLSLKANRSGDVFLAGLKHTIIRGGLESLFFSGAHFALKPFVGGVGVILTMHQVRPPRPERFQPNRLLEIRPRFLSRVVKLLRRSRVDVVSLDEMHRRMTERDFRRRFVCLTFDDGYRDIKEHAYPILKAAGMPFAVYVATSFPDRLGELWWLALEAVIARNERIGLVIGGRNRTFDCCSVAEKRALFDELYWWLRGQPSETELRAIMRNLAACYQVDISAFCKELCMDWGEIAELAADPLVTIGAHTVNHPILAKLPERTARSEIDLSRSVIEAALGTRPAHLAYPFGDPSSAGPREFEIAEKLGFKTAVTTRPGVVFRSHRAHMMALPRISLNGEYQQLRYVRVLLSGSATAMWNGFRGQEAA